MIKDALFRRELEKGEEIISQSVNKHSGFKICFEIMKLTDRKFFKNVSWEEAIGKRRNKWI